MLVSVTGGSMVREMAGNELVVAIAALGTDPIQVLPKRAARLEEAQTVRDGLSTTTGVEARGPASLLNLYVYPHRQRCRVRSGVR